MIEKFPRENDIIGNEITFPVTEKKIQKKTAADNKKLFLTFLIGFFLIAGTVMGIRCSFFINAGYADGVVAEIKSFQKYSFSPLVTFITEDNKAVTFTGAANLRLEKGAQVKVIYKKHNPGRAAIYSFFGFWFNSLLVCQVLLFFWTGLLINYYGDYP